MESYRSIRSGLIYYCVLCQEVFIDSKTCKKCNKETKEIGWVEE